MWGEDSRDIHGVGRTCGRLRAAPECPHTLAAHGEFGGLRFPVDMVLLAGIRVTGDRIPAETYPFLPGLNNTLSIHRY